MGEDVCHGRSVAQHPSVAKMAEVKTYDELNEIKGFKVTHLNVRSILKKIDQLRIFFQNSEIDVLTFSETWLGSHLQSGLVGIEGYKLYRADRAAKGKKKKRGGGLITYIKNKYSSSCEQLGELNVSDKNLEAQWFLIHRPHCKNVVICNLYRPPSGNLDKAVSYLGECFDTINTDKSDVFILGDLNVDFQNKSSPSFKKVNFFAQSRGLAQLVSTTTRNTSKSQTLLDVVLSNSRFIKQAGTLEHHISDHQPIYVVHKKGRDKRESVRFEGRSYRNYDRDIFKEMLREEVDWEKFLEIRNPENAWDYMLEQIIIILDKTCPIRTFHIKNYRPDWMTDELIEQIKDRDYFYCKAKANGNEDDWNIAKYLRNTTNSNIRCSKREFVLKELNENGNDAKKFWKVIRKVIPSKQSSSQDILLKRDVGQKIERHLIPDYINEFFINVGKVDCPKNSTAGLSHTGPSGAEALPEQTKPLDRVTEAEVYKIIKDINVSKSSGIDNLSSFILKEVFIFLIPEVTHMFNLSIESSIFPSSWKEALVVPIPKIGNLSLVQNYRPISLLPLPGKILEKLVHKQLTDYLDDNLLLSDKQHGFRKSHSTTHSAAQLVNFVNHNMDVKKPTLAVYIDFRKAFDCVQHNVLMTKLEQLKLHPSVLDWILSYLSGRKQRVYANNMYSDFSNITQGVPQGSVLGPLFYIIYANDLSELFKHCRFALYADDTVLYTANRMFTESVSQMQQDISALSTWCKLNGLRVNTSKTKVMVFGSTSVVQQLPPFEILYDDAPLQKVSSYNYLGVTLDWQLNYNLHVKKLISTVSAKLKQLQRMRSFLNTKAALMVNKSMLLPILEYGDIFLSATSLANRKKIQTLQNRGLRCALSKSVDAVTTDELHTEASLLKLKYRREQHSLNFVYDWSLDDKLIAVKPEGSVSTRSDKKRLFKIKKPRTEKFKKSLSYKGKTSWNALPVEFHQTASKTSFKLLVANLVTQKVRASENP